MILGQLRMGARQAKNAALVLSCPVPKMSKGAQNDRKGWLPLLLPYGQLFQILFGVQKEVFFGAKTLFWALFSVFLMDQNPFLMTSTRICGNIINNCFKKGQKKEAFSPHRSFHAPPSHLEVYERSQTHSWWSRSPGGCPAPTGSSDYHERRPSSSPRVAEPPNLRIPANSSSELRSSVQNWAASQWNRWAGLVLGEICTE